MIADTVVRMATESRPKRRQDQHHPHVAETIGVIERPIDSSTTSLELVGGHETSGGQRMDGHRTGGGMMREWGAGTQGTVAGRERVGSSRVLTESHCTLNRPTASRVVWKPLQRLRELTTADDFPAKQVTAEKFIPIRTL
ncbi:hypothetical protein CP557_00260 [Natrinema ejinorense]|uniref:Uncharacterized protein n=1 Tax=Natrinema ejinorense TaxID=373386 RepID=A0A2A5QQS6_9EURY|nr:hypothetical protein CP557_00260 [Natrinema ejinorense]